MDFRLFREYGTQPLYWTTADLNDNEIYGGGISGNDNFPAIGVSWYEADAYCKWLSKKTGKTYRMPAEAEWGKAANYNVRRRGHQQTKQVRFDDQTRNLRSRNICLFHLYMY